MLCIWKKYIFILLQTLSKYLHCLFRYNSFIWIVDGYSILLHWVIYLSIIIKHNEKKYTNQTIRKEKPDFWVWQALNACSKQSLQELQVLSTMKRKFLVSSEKFDFCWLKPPYCLFLAGMAGFLEKFRTHCFYLLTICFLRFVSSLLFAFACDFAHGMGCLGREDRQDMDSLCKRQS